MAINKNDDEEGNSTSKTMSRVVTATNIKTFPGKRVLAGCPLFSDQRMPLPTPRANNTFSVSTTTPVRKAASLALASAPQHSDTLLHKTNDNTQRHFAVF